MAHTSCTAPARHGLCDHLAANVQMWLQDDTRAREIGLRGRRLVAEQFNLASVYRHMDAMVRRLGELQSDRAVSKMITALRGVPITQRNYEDVMLRPGALPENGRRTSVDELVGTLRLHRKLLFADGGGPHGVVEAEDRAAPTVNDYPGTLELATFRDTDLLPGTEQAAAPHGSVSSSEEAVAPHGGDVQASGTDAPARLLLRLDRLWAVLLLGQITVFLGASSGVTFIIPDLRDDLGLTQTSVALAYTLGTAMSAFVQMPIRRTVDRWGGRKAVTVYSALFFCSVAGMSLPRRWLELAVAFGLLRALGVGGLELSCNTCLQQWFARRRGCVTGVGQSGNAILSYAVVSNL
eukprot:3032198-Prymnesium_polylepis.2